MTWFRSASVQFPLARHHSKRRRRWVGVKGSTRNGRHDPKCPSARRLRMGRREGSTRVLASQKNKWYPRAVVNGQGKARFKCSCHILPLHRRRPSWRGGVLTDTMAFSPAVLLRINGCLRDLPLFLRAATGDWISVPFKKGVKDDVW
ncbi:hypothetical protein TNCV_3003701 [Trichonephila clavipes]|nr:hypothetical protein TNCV_3003701 [Trichonephila clavipes]